MMLDSASIKAVAKAVMTELDARQDKGPWLTPKQVKARYGMISGDFLARHGHELERKRIKTPSGCATHYAYSQRSLDAMLTD